MKTGGANGGGDGNALAGTEYTWQGRGERLRPVSFFTFLRRAQYENLRTKVPKRAGLLFNY